MTLSKLIKKLQALEVAHGGRHKVSVDKNSLWDGNGTFDICGIEDASVEYLNISDGDGFHVVNKNGTERMRTFLVLKGRGQ